MTELSAWQNFYVIVGSSAGALIGLQFVVITLMADMPLREGTAQAGGAFATPTIVHFSGVLLLAGMLSAPWNGIGPAAALWELMAVSGIVYTAIVVRRMHKQIAYKPEFEDWLFHVLLPFVAYTVLALSALAVRPYVRVALFAVAGSAMLLLFIGIHNAWDAITYTVFVVRRQAERGRDSEP